MYTQLTFHVESTSHNLFLFCYEITNFFLFTVTDSANCICYLPRRSLANIINILAINVLFATFTKQEKETAADELIATCHHQLQTETNWFM